MSKKSNKADAIENQVEEAKPVQEQPESIYLVETLTKLDEIQKYGLNKYFLHAILPDKYYTLRQAEALIESFINDPNK